MDKKLFGDKEPLVLILGRRSREVTQRVQGSEGRGMGHGLGNPAAGGLFDSPLDLYHRPLFAFPASQARTAGLGVPKGHDLATPRQCRGEHIASTQKHLSTGGSARVCLAEGRAGASEGSSAPCSRHGGGNRDERGKIPWGRGRTAGAEPARVSGQARPTWRPRGFAPQAASPLGPATALQRRTNGRGPRR